MNKKIELQLDDEMITAAKDILDEIGLDCQTFAKMCFKKLNREKNISFLMSETLFTSPSVNTSNITLKNEEQRILQDMENLDMTDYGKTTKNKVTEQMSDLIWETFKTHYSPNKKFDRHFYAKAINAKCGMTVGTAKIYFQILENLVNGTPNQRTLKFDYLVAYVNRIKEQLPHICIENALKSLSDSIPYWETHLNGHFADKVRNLIAQYK